jgi:hypothetical protein
LDHCAALQLTRRIAGLSSATAANPIARADLRPTSRATRAPCAASIHSLRRCKHQLLSLGDCTTLALQLRSNSALDSALLRPATLVRCPAMSTLPPPLFPSSLLLSPSLLARCMRDSCGSAQTAVCWPRAMDPGSAIRCGGSSRAVPLGSVSLDSTAGCGYQPVCRRSPQRTLPWTLAGTAAAD